MKSSNFVIDGSIPSEWYVDSLFECLKSLPPDLQNNDYENLYNSLMIKAHSVIFHAECRLYFRLYLHFCTLEHNTTVTIVSRYSKAQTNIIFYLLYR